jgi:exopolyphosphatase / guanosine-5'-triphosphate,3'-diphosphate pyrophosphatase
MTERTLYVHVSDHTTQFVVKEGDALSMYEIPVGCAQITRDDLGGDPPRAEELSNAIAMVQNHMDDVLRELPAVTQCSRAIGLGRTVWVIAAIELGVPESSPDIEGFRLSRDAAEDVYRTVATETLDDRRHNPGLPPDHAPVIVGGCCIVVAIMRRLYLHEIVLEHVVGPVADMLNGSS